MTGSTNPRLKRTLFIGSMTNGETERLLLSIENEQVRCVIDLRPVRHPGAEGALAALRLGAESREMYYAHVPELVTEHHYERGQPSRSLVWTARTALRYCTCLVTGGTASERQIAHAVAGLVGLRVIDLDPPHRRRSETSD